MKAMLTVRVLLLALFVKCWANNFPSSTNLGGLSQPYRRRHEEPEFMAKEPKNQRKYVLVLFIGSRFESAGTLDYDEKKCCQVAEKISEKAF